MEAFCGVMVLSVVAFTRCTRQRWSASARARHTGLRVRRQGVRRDDPIARQGWPVLTHVKAMLGKPYDDHTLATGIPEMEAPIGNTIGAS